MVHGVNYERCELAKSDLYLAAIPLMSSKRVELLDNDRMVKEFRRLERKRGRGGKDTVQDGGRHDDLVNAIAGAVYLVIAKPVADPRAIPIAVGTGIGAELRKAVGSWRDSPNPFTNDGRLSRGIPVRSGYDDED